MREQKQGWNVVQKQPPKPSASTSRGFPLRYATSYDNASFNLQQKAAGGLQKRGQPRVKYPEKRFRKQPPPKPRPVFLLPTRYRGPAPTRKGYRVEQLHFGVLDRDGSTFHSELQPTFVDGHLDTELDAEFLHITAEAFDKLPIRIVIAFDSVESFIVDHTAGSGGTLLLTLSFAPSLEVFTSPSPMDVVRVTAYSADHRQIAPYTSRHILLTFSSSDVLLPLLVALESLPLPRPTVKILSVTHKHLQHYSQEKLLAFRVRLGSIPPPYAFQFEAILHEGLLFPFEFTELFESRILELDVIHGELVTERILVELKKRLSSDRMARTTEVLLLDAAAAEAREPVELPPFSLGGLLEESVHAVVESREQLHLVTDDQHFLCRHVCTTPTTMSFTGPFVEQGNSMIRRHPGAIANLLRVTFVEEDLARLQVGRWGISSDFLHSHLYSTLTQSLDLCGRYFEFLAYSQSSLRSHTVWMLNPFDPEITGPLELDDLGEEIYPDAIDAEAVRQSLGDFQKIQDRPTLYGARLSQGFTSSRASISLREDEILTIPDIVTENDLGVAISNHTDGAGTMSAELRDHVWWTLINSGQRRDQGGPPPDVFQIRLGGSKGIIVLDKSLRGRQLALRPSMLKFKAYFDDKKTSAYVLHIAESFSRPGTLHLNRPLVSALEDLGIAPKVFLGLQEFAIEDLLQEKTSLLGALSLLRRYEFGAGIRLQALLASFARLGKVSADILVDEPFIKAAMDLLTARVLREFKYSARIPLPGCYNLVGVPDLGGKLEEDQIYVAIRENEEVTYLEGRVAVTRSPTLDAGDVRILRAVGKLPPSYRISALHNCVVFSTKGERAIVSTMGGGDLDGDQYNIITLPELIPSRTSEPLSHVGVPAYRLQKPCTMEDVASCFTDFVANDNVGLIATTHLRIADASKLHGADPRCKVLADKYSLAVDTAKTGVHVPLHEIPPFGKSRPDFLAYEGSNRAHYESQRALGQLFRAIPDARVALDPTSSFVDDSTSPHLDSLRTRLVRSAQELFGFKPLPLNDELIAMCASLRRSFCAELQLLAVVGHYPRRQGKSLSEVEVFVGSVAAESGGKGARDKKGAKEAATALRFRMSSLGQGVEDMLGKGCLGDNFSAAWACWDEALAVDEAEFGVKSFRWLCASMALTYLERIEEKGAAWREDLSVPPTPASTPGSSSRLGSRSATPSQAAHGTPLDRLVKPPSAPSTNTKTTRRKEREAAALKLAEERRRLDALAEKDVKGPGAWVVDVAYQEEGPEEGWGVEDWGTTAPKKAPVATAAPLPSKPAWGGAGAGRGAEWSGRGRGAGGEDGRFPTLDISRGRGRGVMSGVAAPTPSPPILRPTPTPPRSTSSIRSTSALSTNSSVANAPAPPPPAARNDNSPLSIRPAQIPTRPAPAPAPPTTGWDEPSSAASSNDGWGVEWGPTAEQDSAKEAAGKGGASAWGSGWG